MLFDRFTRNLLLCSVLYEIWDQLVSDAWTSTRCREHWGGLLIIHMMSTTRCLELSIQLEKLVSLLFLSFAIIF